jgi:LmbE family N-acetylglucosaminyl deacetylase
MNMQLEKINRVLCLGAHSDDIEIGCGGTLLKLVEANPALRVEWAVFGADGARRKEALASAKAFLAGASGRSIWTGKFRDGFFPEHWAAVKAEFKKIKRRCEPDLVLTVGVSKWWRIMTFCRILFGESQNA